VSDDGFCSLMTPEGVTKEDLKLPEGELGEEIKKAFEEGKEMTVSVVSAMGIEQIMSMKVN